MASMSDQVPPFAPGGVYNSAFTGQQHETERDRRGTTPTPATMSMSQPPMLPPLQQQHHHQHYDGPQYAPQAMHHHHQPPPTYHAPGQFVYQNGAMQQPPAMPSNMLVNGQNGAMRYALPPQVDARNLASRNATSKQIKRRTKTGCLTCRKRRIKCDEAHPECKNCQKSKRECLGYGPIFKQQTGPPTIQPAPSLATTTSKSSTLTTFSPQTFTPPQNFVSAANPFGPPLHPQSHADSTFDYQPSLDPILSPEQENFNMAQHMGPALQPARRVSPLDINQLFAVNNVEPRWQMREAPPPMPSTVFEEISEFFRLHYATGLDKLFETTWYSTHGLAHLQRDSTLLDFVSQCSEQMGPTAEDKTLAPPLEARMVWQLCTMPRSAAQGSQAYGAINDPLLADLLPRIETVENILTGQFLPMVRIPSPPGPDHANDHRKHNEMHFWHQLGRFTSVHDDSPDPSAARDINEALIAMRTVLGLMENRDVLYSLAITRCIGGRLPEFDPSTQLSKTGNSENDVDKLETARAFVDWENERGQTQIIQRICGMAMRGAVLQKA